MNIRAFVKDVLHYMHDQRDEDLEDLALEHGLIGPSISYLEYTDELKAWLEEGAEPTDNVCKFGTCKAAFSGECWLYGCDGPKRARERSASFLEAARRRKRRDEG